MPHNPTSAWRAELYTSVGAFVPALGDAILGALAPQPDERILDVGCGDGALTLRIAEAGARVVGIDADPTLVAAARQRGLDIVFGDAAEMSFESEFDAVFSNAALHWMLRVDDVAQAMYCALRPGGRLAVEFGGFGNIAAIRTALKAVLSSHGYEPPADQFYPTAEQYAEVLTAAGFVDIETVIVPRPTPLTAGLAVWLETFRGGLFDHLGIFNAHRAEIIESVVDLLNPALQDSTGLWWADYVRIRVFATKPAGD